jgi:4-amino-4-deoxy-L-arabinose transferase-like glycosyltransferase
MTQRDAWKKTMLIEEHRSDPTQPRNHATTPLPRRAWLSTTALIAFATFIRATSFVLFWKTLGPNREWGFFTIVQNWFLGYGYSFVPAVGCASAYRSPGYLFFLTGVYGLFGFANFFAQEVIQNLFAILLVYLVYRLGWSITKDRRVGLIAGLLISLHPYTFYHYTQYYHTALSGCLLVGVLLALLALERTKQWRWAVIGGICIAGLAYIQGTILPATIFLSLWLFIRWWPNWRHTIGAIAVMGIVSIVLIAPWTIRNYKVFHAFVPLTTDLGQAFAKANHPLNYAMTALGYPQEAFSETVDPSNPLMVRYAPLPEVAADLRAHGIEPADNYFFGPLQPIEPGLRQTCADQAQMNEVQFNAYWMAQAKTWMVVHYWPDVVKLQIQKIAGFWSPSLTPSQKYGAAWSFGNTGLRATLARDGLMAYVLLVEILGLIGLFVIAKKKRFTFVVPILVIFVVYTLLHSLFAGYTKYRIPLDNLLVILAAIAVIGTWDRLRKR